MSDEARAGRPDADAARGSRSGPEEKRLQGHWLLAKMGKRVLRPGGIELTRRVVKAARPAKEDRIVEFGPGVGRTAEILLAAEPKEYVGVDPNSFLCSKPASDVRRKYIRRGLCLCLRL